jgi:hypothetical protein
MTVNKLNKGQAPYEAISRAVIQDASVSIEARGMWALMLSMPDRWSFHDQWLADACACGRTKRERMVVELTDAGLLEVEHHRNEDGTFAGKTYHVHPEPIHCMKPADGSSARGERAAIERTLKKETEPERRENTPSTEVEEHRDDSQFEIFWEAYGKKVGKKATRSQWCRHVTAANVDEVIWAAHRQRETITEPVYRKDPERWLRDHRWVDEHISERPKPNTAAARSTTAIEKLLARKSANEAPRLIEVLSLSDGDQR